SDGGKLEITRIIEAYQYLMDSELKNKYDKELKGVKRKKVYTMSEPEQDSKKQKKKPINTSIYISNLPVDVTENELAEACSKYGVLMVDLATGHLKGDALVTYLKEESVTLACQLLDETILRPEEPYKIRVQKAEFKEKDPKILESSQSNSKKVDKYEVKKKLRQLEKAERYNKIAILKHMFTIEELEEDIRNECEKLGEVTNVVLYDKEPEGIVSVKFKDQISAEACVLKMNGRFFAGRRVEAEIFDGKQKYQKTGSKSNETDEEEATRLEKYAKWLEEQNTGTASAKTNTINVDVGSDDLGASGSSTLDNRESETPDRLKWAPQGIEANNLVKENPEQNTKTTTENNLVNALRSFRNQNLLQTKQSAITEKDILINRPQQRSKEELRAKN
ncbi:10864_t:CDS:10, partial [Entrophospora sp. SA101]